LLEATIANNKVKAMENISTVWRVRHTIEKFVAKYPGSFGTTGGGAAEGKGQCSSRWAQNSNML